MRDVISAGLRGKSCRRAFSNGSIACPPGKCPVARVQSDTLRPADWTIGYSSPRSDIAVTTNYWTEIAAELGCAFSPPAISPGEQRATILPAGKSFHHTRPPRDPSLRDAMSKPPGTSARATQRAAIGHSEDLAFSPMSQGAACPIKPVDTRENDIWKSPNSQTLLCVAKCWLEVLAGAKCRLNGTYFDGNRA
jgi:hypothetical protein